MEALIIIDGQNEFSSNGKRAVPNFDQATQAISERVAEARRQNRPVAWVRHFNKPDESSAFVPGTWGSQFYDGFGPQEGRSLENEFHKDVYGASRK